MDHDFSKPQKQSAAGIIIMFADTLQKVIRAAALPILFIFIKSGGQHTWTVVSGTIALILILAVFAYIRYIKFTFFLDEDKQEFIINKGVFSRTTLTIQLNKIQQANINQSLLQQMIGVYSLDIDTAGSDKKEASIKAVDHTTATLLKQKLLSRDTFAAESGQLAAAETESAIAPFLKLSNFTLLKVGITSNYGASIALLTGFIFGLFQLIKDYNSAFEIEENQLSHAFSKGFSVFSLCFLLIAALILVLGTNIIRTFIRYFDFKIIKQKRSLAVSSGLFTKHNTLLKPGKVQLSAYSQNYFQKKLGMLNIKVKQASYSSADEEDEKKSAVEIPGCDEMERDEILKMIFDRIPAKGKALLPNYRFLFLRIMLCIVLPLLAVFLVGFLLLPLIKPYFILAIPYILIVITLLYFEYKHHRLYAGNGFIIKRSGIWDIEHEIIEPHKIQAITAKQYFWHKKADVGHLIVHTAAGVIHFKYGNYTHIKNLVNYWIYKVESSKEDWM
ncbi:MAG TPA: PH domain-containing protein [Pedobacter sp.]|uniref:PH domain-containing protein n=1 Tax=Pedobacter sp. TaxID=1411316 RepID=UPI002C7EF9AF|nr:PH domain-containing protein [Pedobacter sp.]HMI04357.1 PH domain-containing protein [Pedobacter sp.]